MADDFIQVLVNLEEEQGFMMVQEQLDANADPLKILDDSPLAIRENGERFSNEQYFFDRRSQA